MSWQTGCLSGLSFHPTSTEAEWVGAIGTVLAFVGLAVGLIAEARRRGIDLREHSFQLASEQARQVAGFLDNLGIGSTDGDRRLNVTIINASNLPIRAVRALVRRIADDAELTSVDHPIVQAGHTDTVATVRTPADEPVYVVLDYDDDAGVRWRKYDRDRPLKRLST
jgi:hypothetical protein